MFLATLVSVPIYGLTLELTPHKHVSDEVIRKKEKAAMDPHVLNWLQEAPFGDPEKIPLRPNFSYEDWFARGRALNAADTLIALLNYEDPQHPSGDGMRAAYALGWIGQKGEKRAVNALLRSLHSKDVALRMEAASALGRLGDVSVLPVLEDLLTDKQEDVNVRANACIAVGRLGVASSEGILRRMLKDSDPFIVHCAEEALRLLKSSLSPPLK